MLAIKWMLVLAALAVGCSDADDETVVDRTPDSVVTSMSLGANPGEASIFFIDLNTGEKWDRPFSELGVPGLPMHTAMTADRRTVFVTMNGDMSLPLRLVVVDIAWPNGQPKLSVRTIHEVSPAGVKPKQEGHGPSITKDGRFLLFSEMQNNKLRIYDIKNDVLRPAIEHESLTSPHGLWPNPAHTRVVSPQYQFDAYSLSLWNLDKEGNITFDRTIRLSDGTVGGAYQHSITWLDDNRFYADSTQELMQGTTGTAEASVWLVDIAAGTTKAIIRQAASTDSTGVLKGVSYNVVAAGKLYTCEGNVEEKGQSAGYVSVWDISNQAAPMLIKRMSAGAGLPDSFRECHELAATPDGRYVFAQSFSSDWLLQIDTSKDSVAKEWGKMTVRVPHGLTIR